MEFSEAIRARRERAVQRSLAVLETYDASDDATRGTFLKVAAKAFPDSRVAQRWIALLAAESDPGQRERLLKRLAELDFRQVPPDSDCVAHLMSCLEQPDAREVGAVLLVAPWRQRDPQLVAPLIAAYRSQRDAQFARNILAALMRLGNPAPEVLEFFVSVLDEVGTTIKINLVKRLLEQDALKPEALEKLLAPTEPSLIKQLVLDHLVDRSLQCDNAAAELLRRDPDPACRYAAAWALTESGAPSADVLDALLKAAGSDVDERVREFAIASFEHTLAKSPAVIQALLEALRQETSLPRASLILHLLAPHIHREAQIVSALTALLENNCRTDLALQIYPLLGVLARTNESLRAWLIDAFVREKEDRLKAAILRPLSKIHSDDPRISALCVDALKLPEPEIQQWGVQGVLLLPLTPEHFAALYEAATLLLSPNIPLDLRVRLAHKIALLPAKPAPLMSRLKETASQSRDTQIRQICDEICNNAVSDKSGASSDDDPGIDWKDWLHRAEIEHRADGIFPAILEHYDDAPDDARRVLKALLNPQCSNSLYSSYGYDFGESHILALLDRKNAIDDDVSRFCIGRVLMQDGGSPDGFLQYLIANPSYAALKESLWPILEKRQDANAALMRQLLVIAHGDEDAAAQALTARIRAIRGTEALGPYIRLLAANLAWPPSRELLLTLSQHADLTGDARVTVAAALKRLGVQAQNQSGPPAQKQEPGFADD